MTIYTTEYKESTKETEPSIDSGFESLDQVVAAFGAENCNTEHPKIILFGDGEDRIAYSNFIFRIDGSVTKD